MATFIIKRFSSSTLNENAEKVINITSNLSLKKVKLPFIGKILGKLIKRIRESQKAYLSYEVYYNNVEVGSIDLHEESETELNIVWVEIKNKYSGRGYAQEVMNWVINFARNLGYKYLSLEVPGNSPNARHIYNKLGFKETGRYEYDDYWGGLTWMKKKL